MDKNISIITNFGCRAKCWYCIWKGHELQHVNAPTDWNKLEQFLVDNQPKGKVSISGGGDPLYKYKENEDWWNKLFDITNRLNMLVDVHTREKFIDREFWSKINRCVFSSDHPLDDLWYLNNISGLVKLRITHLVTNHTTFEMIGQYLDFVNETGIYCPVCQFTIKQLIGYNDGGKYEMIKKALPNIYHLDAGDYNIYYMPDNTIRSSFL